MFCFVDNPVCYYKNKQYDEFIQYLDCDMFHAFRSK